MKKSTVSLAVLSALSTGALAQSSVTLYGIVDAAVAVEDTGETGKGSRKVLNSGNQSSSRIGLRGEEDLGGGLKAEFNIESGLALDTGTADSAFWGRRAVVGLKGGFGSFFLGRETLIPKLGSEMAYWRELLFVVMFRNAGSATAFFNIPSNRVVELGSQVLL